MHREASAIHVTVCICTYRRTHVRETIASILAQDCLDCVPVEILVCDDDPAGSAKPLVETAAKEALIAIRYVTSGASNIAAARNKCLAEARGRWIAFIDDDEIAERDWLSKLIETQRAYGADVVKGYVRGVYPPKTPGWVLAGNPYTRDFGPTGKPLQEVGAGNVFFTHELVETHELRFDARFGRSGGEDTDFFQRAHSLGARIVASREAIVDEVVPPDRVTRDYIRSRFRRQGQTRGRQLSNIGSRSAALAEGASAAMFVFLGWMYPAARLFGGWFYFWCFAKFWYALGVVQGLRGHITEEVT